MEPEVKTNITSSDASTSETSSGAITKLSPPANNEADWQKTAQQVNTFMQEFPTFLEEFWLNYRLLLTVFGFFLVFIVVTKILFAVLGAINDLPLLEPLFELIGITYFGWFVVRYLWSGTGRQELGNNLNSVKSQVVGGQEKVLDRLSSGADQ